MNCAHGPRAPGPSRIRAIVSRSPAPSTILPCSPALPCRGRPLPLPHHPLSIGPGSAAARDDPPLPGPSDARLGCPPRATPAHHVPVYPCAHLFPPAIAPDTLPHFSLQQLDIAPNRPFSLVEPVSFHNYRLPLSLRVLAYLIKLPEYFTREHKAANVLFRHAGLTARTPTPPA